MRAVRWCLIVICALALSACGGDDGETQEGQADGGVAQDGAMMEDGGMDSAVVPADGPVVAEDVAPIDGALEDWVSSDWAGEDIQAQDSSPEDSQGDLLQAWEDVASEDAVVADLGADVSLGDASPDGAALTDVAPLDASPDLQDDVMADLSPDLSLWSEVSILGLEPFASVYSIWTVEGTVEGDAAAVLVELLVDDVAVDAVEPEGPGPWSFTWDTTTAEEGVHLLTLAAETEDGSRQVSAPAHVIVLNEGWEMTLQEGNTGEIVIPDPYAGEDVHLKHHWVMEPAMLRVLATLACDGEGWAFEVAIGTGECPHSGQKLADARDEGGRLWVDYTDPEGSLPEETWFHHIAPLGPAEHQGETLPYTVKVVAWPND